MALGLCLAASGVAQEGDSQAVTVKTETTKPKKEKFKGEVLFATRVAITVRSQENFNLVRTFTYDEKLGKKIAEQFDRNKTYRHGDRVKITYLAGGDQAIKIEGKPGQKQSK